MNRIRILIVAFACGLFGHSIAKAEHVWIEGEAPASVNLKPNIAGWGRKQFLSGETWLHVSVEADKVEKEAPEDGVLILYKFDIAKAASYEVWNRIGFEFARSRFDWRLDNGDWTTVSPEDLTTDLMEIDFFCEVAWLKLGDHRLEPGAHSLEIRLSKTRNKDGKPDRILYASDALCLSSEPFFPNSKYPPGEEGRDDRDREAGSNAFTFPSKSDQAQRQTLDLDGLWEVTRDDEQRPGPVDEPIEALPQHSVWRAIEVPGDKNKQRPDLIFAHRLWYRTRVNLPENVGSSSWSLLFPQNSLNTTVFVNGQYCGFGKSPFAHFQVDISNALKPGLNEIQVGIRDAWYGRTANPDDPMKLRRTFNLPIKFFHDGFQDLDYPVWASPQSGILTTPQLVRAGSIYSEDVFVKPSVSQKRIQAEVAIRNTSERAGSGEVRWEAVDDETNQVVRTFASHAFEFKAGAQQTLELSDAWDDPKLWWPNDPHLYRLRVTVVVGGEPVDVRETRFGFREWKIEGTKFTLNGVVWHLWGDLVGSEPTKEAWLRQYRESHQRLMRLATAGQGGEASGWMGLSPDEALDFFDRNGVVVRRNSTLDGEAIGYNFVEKDPKIREKQGGSELKLTLMKNVRDQFVAQVKGERNHPSIQIWSMENEFAYINLINLLGNSPIMDAYEVEEQKIADSVMRTDPTRSVMTDGGGAFKANTMPVHGDHYVATLDQRYPDLAYEPFPEGGGRGRWRWDQNRPRYIGEEFFANGINPADYAMWGGEAAFQGKAQTREAIARIYDFLTQGYRWGGHYAAWHLWLGNEAPGQYDSTPWQAAFIRQYDSTFASDSKVVRTFGLFNDTQFPDPLTFGRSLTLNGEAVWSKTTTHTIEPGANLKFDESIDVPSVSERAEGELVLSLKAGDHEVFRQAHPVSVLPEPAYSSIKDGQLAVLDPQGRVSDFLKSKKVPFTPVQALDAIPEAVKVLLIGPDALSAGESTSSRLAAHASPGRVVIVLEQTHPLKYQATPAGLEPATDFVKDGSGKEVPVFEGRSAFPEDLEHPAFRGLRSGDFLFWAPDHVVYRHPYLKPSRNGRSLVQAGPRLQETALVEIPAGKGLLVLSQLTVGETLAENPVARHLLVNLIRYGSEYRQEFREVVVSTDDPRLVEALDAIGLRYSRQSDVLQALDPDKAKLAIVSATPGNLRMLSENLDRVKSFTREGGYLVVHGLTPEGLKDYNMVVGFDHLIRPFRRERVTFPTVRNPLTAGLSSGDIVMLSGERIFGWTADEYVSSDVFQFVVDDQDIAPFATSSFHAYNNITNGFVGADGWPLIIDFPAPKAGSTFDIPIKFPREETVVGYTHTASTNYWPTTRINLVFDQGEAITLDLEPNNEPQSFVIDPPRKTTRLTVQIADYQKVEGKTSNVGIDNIAIQVARSPEFLETVRPMLNVGGLMQYTKGKGGIVLCNLNLMEKEPVPVNTTKKRTILATVLRNLKAPFSGGATLIAGSNLDYSPIDLGAKANQYRNERGWFGDRKFTFASMPTGKQTFADVPYAIHDFATSPVPTVIMLGGPGIPNNPSTEVRGIPVNRKADALFFLQASRINRTRNPREIRDRKTYELARYVIHYENGREVEVPILQDIDIADYRQKEPSALPGAQVAWTRPYEGSDLQAVAYAKQWDNPHPDVPIRSIDVLPGKDRDRGTLALIAITAASSRP